MKYTPNQILDLVLLMSEEAALSMLKVGLRCFENPDKPYFSDDSSYEFGLDNWPSSHDYKIYFNQSLLMIERFEKAQGRFVLFGYAPLLFATVRR